MPVTTFISNPKISGQIRDTAFYEPLTMGRTRPLLLIGHSDAPDQETPYRVGSMKEAVNWLQADSTAPLMRGLLEAYNAGCRDIWLYSAAPMSEYRSDIASRNSVEASLGNKTFYEKYHERLQKAYSLLRNYDTFQVIVPLEASYCKTSDIDFTTPLAQLCEDIFTKSSRSAMGVIGTRASQYNQALFTEMVTDSTLSTIGSKGRYIMVVSGEGVIINQQMSSTYNGSLSTQVAALLATVPLDRSIFGINLSGVASISGFDMNEAQIKQMTEARINPVLRTQRGKRGQPFECWLTTDNSLAPFGSDYWSINQVRVVSDIANTLKSYGEAFVGTIATESFKQVVYDYLEGLARTQQITDYNADVQVVPRTGTATITLSIVPVFGIRNIYFTVETGPGS